MKHTYEITGMTCEGCKAKVKRVLESFEMITDAEIDLASGQAQVLMTNHVDTASLQSALSEKGKYTITEAHVGSVATGIVSKDSGGFFSTYKPLLLIVVFIGSISLLAQYPFNTFSQMLWMRYFMAGFFIVFSFFKLLNLRGFADSYRMYDIVAAKWGLWGLIYPFVELVLGISYLLNWNPVFTNWVTVVVLGISSIGVIKSNLNKAKIKCACLGDVFNLPMSVVTIVEDVAMVAMAIVMLAL